MVPLIDGVLIEVLGQIPLEGLDLVVRPKTRDVMPNPAHPDGPVMEILAAV